MTHEPDRNSINSTKCAICGNTHDSPEFASRYVTMVCKECDARAVNTDGNRPDHDSCGDSGDNPVFIDGQQCWRRYKFGGFVTMRDFWNSRDIGEFYDTLM